MLVAATRAFARRGYHAVSVDELAAGARISKPGLYSYFPSKEELYVSVLRRYSERLAERIARAADAGGSPEEKMWGGVRAYVGFVAENRDGWQLLAREAVAVGSPVADEVQRARSRLIEVIAELFRGTMDGVGLGEGPITAVEPLVYAFVGAVEGMGRWWMDHPEVPRGSVEMYLMNIAWQGFGDLIEGRLWLPGGDG
jgi:AcrR family transcriptional regulator